MKKYESKMIKVNDLLVNPENYRYINDADDERTAIISMFNVTTGNPHKEMINLAKDIVVDGLNPFEMPIVCYDDVTKKYIVYDGNRRITCIKLMTQYKHNESISKAIPCVEEIYKLSCNITEIQCVVYEDVDDAIHCLYKIHQDVNDGVGRKQWDYQAKMKAEAAKGNKSKTYSIIEFVKNNPKADKNLINDMDTHRWVSKLERVVGFAKFKEVYNITFDTNNTLVYKDTEEHLLFMMSKLISDLINNSATNNFRFKSDFENYISNLEDEYKTQISVPNDAEASKARTNVGLTQQKDENKKIVEDDIKNEKVSEVCRKAETLGQTSSIDAPRSISKKYLAEKAALRLGKNYDLDDYNCFGEKGKEMIVELESLNIREYPVASAAMCRASLENILKLWADMYSEIAFDSNALPSTYNKCLNALRNKKIISDKEHSVLKAQINKEDYIKLLNTWIHSDTSACVSETNLVSGWKNVRLLVEKYIETHKK